MILRELRFSKASKDKVKRVGLAPLGNKEPLWVWDRCGVKESSKNGVPGWCGVHGEEGGCRRANSNLREEWEQEKP